MLAKTHLAFGFLSALVAMPFLNIESKIIFTSLVLLGSLFPDIDTPKSKISSYIPILPRIINLFLGHRGVFHSIFFAILIPYGITYLTSPAYGIAIFIGYISHLMIDGITEQGINFLNPIAKLRISGFIQTGTISEIVILLLIISLIFIKLL